MRPISSTVRLKLADHLQRTGKFGIADSVQRATEILNWMGAAGVDVVMPGWVPIVEGPAQKMPGKPRSWEDLAGALPEDWDERKSWVS